MSVPRPAGPPSWQAWWSLVLRGRIDLDFFTKVAREYPRLAYLHLGPERMYLINHPDLVRAVLVEAHHQTTKSRRLEAAKRVIGDGLLTSEDPLHRRQRRLVAPAFHPDRVVRYAPHMVGAALDRSAGWTDGGTVDMVAEMAAIAFDAVGRSLFGADLRGDVDAVRGALADLLPHAFRAYLPGLDLAMKLGTPLGRTLVAARDRLHAVVGRLIAARRGRPGRDDVLSMLLAARDEAGRPMPDPLVRDEVLTLALAGHETTTAALTFAFVLLDEHPEQAAWLREELDAVLAGRAPTHADLAALPRTRATVAESMRLYPPAWLVGRRVSAPITLDGWPIPAGSSIGVVQWVLHRDPRFWDAALEFRPSRWLARGGAFDETAPGQPRHAYIPFGAGARMCVGENFAWTEATLVLALLAGRWAPARAGSGPVPLRPTITLRPAGPLPMTLHRRTTPGTPRLSQMSEAAS